MDTPDGYNLAKCLHTSPRTLVYSAKRAHDGKSVALKVRRSCSSSESARREFSLLSRAAGPGIVPVFDLDQTVDPPVLVLGRTEGSSLLQYAEGNISLSDFLTLACRLTEALVGLHRHQLIHRNVAPSNIWVHEGGQDLWLLDFDLVLEYGATAGALLHTNEMTPERIRYIAPEQSGRMARGVDFRTDLYSLGATLFHLWCGRPPFDGSDLLEVLHAHAAIAPPSLAKLRGDTPPALSLLVHKLLQKDPEDRYQSAASLLQDLAECRRQVDAGGTIDPDLPLGAADIATRPLFSRKLYGREHEAEVLGAALDRVLEGSRELWLVRGAPGVGKSVLVDALRARILTERGCLVQGKFDLYRRDLQYHGWSQALGELVNQLLARGHASIEEWTQRIRARLGATAAALFELVPDLRFLLGDVDPVPTLGPAETLVRLGATLARFLQAVATPEHPLAIVLDDLQWADSGSRALLLELLRSDRDASLLILGTHRDQDEESRSAYDALTRRVRTCEVPVHELELRPLTADASTQMLAEALARSPDEVRSLADAVLRKTGNNPFLVQQFVEHMRTLQLLRYAPGSGWIWSEEEILSAQVPEGAVGLMVEKIERLDPHLREVLVFASFVGDEFDSGLLRDLARREIHAVEAALFALNEAGMIIPCSSGFRFAHDRIREAAQSLLSPEERASLHYDTANLLFSRLSDSQRKASAIELADQFDRALELIRAEQRVPVIELNLWAAQRTLAAGAPESAKVYAEAAGLLVRDGDAKEVPDLIFELDYARAQIHSLTNEYAESEAILERITPRARTPDQLARVVSQRIEILAIRAREEDGFDGPCAQRATDIATDALRKLGAPYPTNPGPLRALTMLLIAYWKIRKWSADDLMRRASPPDERQAAIAEVERALGPVGFARLFRALYYASYAVRRLDRGYAGPNLPLNLALIGSVLGHLLHRNDAAERLAQIAVELIERGYPSTCGPRTVVTVYYSIYSWTRPLRTCAAELERSIKPAIEEGGDPFMASTAAAVVNRLRADMGSPMALLRQTYEQSIKLAERAGDYGFQRSTEYGLLTLDRLADPRPIDSSEPLRTHSGMHWGELSRGLFWFLLSEHELAAEACANIPDTDGFPTREPFHRGLANAVCLYDAARERKRAHLKTFRRDRRRLRRWAARAPANFRHQILLLDAEAARVKRRHTRALHLVQESIACATASDYSMDAAIARERWACYLLDVRRAMEAARILQQVAEFWAAWGAPAKVTHLRQQHPSAFSLLE